MDLSTTYLGMKLKNPIVPSAASPLTRDLGSIRRLEDSGAAAIVLHSLFEEKILVETYDLERFMETGREGVGSPEATSYLPPMDYDNLGPEEYLNLLRRAKESVDIPVIASLNGVSSGGWTKYAKEMESAGADALELNIYFIPADITLTSADVEKRYVDLVRQVRETVRIPVAVKLSPFFSSMGHVAWKLQEAGADALVLFNRFYQPDFDLEKLEVTPNLVLSRPHELLLPLRWVAIMYGRVPVDFAVTSGIHNHEGVLKAMMAGANVAMMASELLYNGVSRINEILAGMKQWMEQFEYESVAQMRGSMSQRNVTDPAAFERANYLKVVQSFRPEDFGMRV